MKREKILLIVLSVVVIITCILSVLCFILYRRLANYKCECIKCEPCNINENVEEIPVDKDIELKTFLYTVMGEEIKVEYKLQDISNKEDIESGVIFLDEKFYNEVYASIYWNNKLTYSGVRHYGVSGLDSYLSNKAIELDVFNKNNFNFIRGLDNKKYLVLEVPEVTTLRYENYSLDRASYYVFNSLGTNLTYEFNGIEHSSFRIFSNANTYFSNDKLIKMYSNRKYKDIEQIFTKIDNNKIMSYLEENNCGHDKVHEYEITISNNKFQMKLIKSYDVDGAGAC